MAIARNQRYGKSQGVPELAENGAKVVAFAAPFQL
jgi:hypothetical protein